MSEPVLCYVDGSWAYFTTKPLSEQWGDDWNDAPYEHNAGDPYECWPYNIERGDPPWEITKLAWEADLETPAERAMGYSSTYSVENINRRATPWLSTPVYQSGDHLHIWAGTPFSEFIRLIQQVGGKVYREVQP